MPVRSNTPLTGDIPQPSVDRRNCGFKVADMFPAARRHGDALGARVLLRCWMRYFQSPSNRAHDLCMVRALTREVSMPDDVKKLVVDKSKLPSRHVTEGPERAPHRSFLYAMGLTDEQIHQPFVGVASCWNEAAPCNIALMRQAQAVKKGVASAGGTPREFCTITVTDGIA